MNKINLDKNPIEHTGTVLVVDDDEDFRLMALEIFKDEEIPCIIVGSKDEALKILDKEKIDVVLLDWRLGKEKEMGGSGVLTYCKKHFPLMPVLVVSSSTSDWKTDAIVKGADNCLRKEYCTIRIVSAVRTCLKKAALTPEVFLPRNEAEILSIEEFKNLYIKHVVKLLDGNISKAAEKLGVHRQTVTTSMDEKAKK